jgi:putative heme degradation protein
MSIALSAKKYSIIFKTETAVSENDANYLNIHNNKLGKLWLSPKINCRLYKPKYLK